MLYGSASDPNPNSAFYEFFLQVVYDDSELCYHMFYKYDTLPPTSSHMDLSDSVTDCIAENCNITGQFNCIYK